MQIGIEDVTSIKGDLILTNAKVSVVANGKEAKIIAKYVDELQAIGNKIISELNKPDAPTN